MPTPDELAMRVFLAYSVKEGDGEPFFSLKKEKSMNPPISSRCYIPRAHCGLLIPSRALVNG